MTDTPLALIRRDMAALCADIGTSNLLPGPLRGKPADLMVILLTGEELGISPMKAVRSIYVVDGKPTLSADLMGGLVMASPVCVYLRPVRVDDRAAEYETLRRGWPEPMRMSYTIEQAQNAGLAGKGNWAKHPAAMLRARCIAALVRAAYPDIMMGIYETDELEESPLVRVREGVVIDVSDQAPAVVAMPAKERLAKKKPTATQDQLADALVDFGMSPSRFREWLTTQPEFAGKDVPPVSAWDAERLGWAVAALRNGLGERFRADIAAADAKDGDDFADDAQVPE